MTSSIGGILYSVPTIAGLRAEREDRKPMYKAVRASRLYEQIVEQIERSIREGKLKPGEQLLAERELAQQFGVSRTAVREAVKPLSEQGLVEADSGRGTFVTAKTPSSMRHSLDSFLKDGDVRNYGYLAELREILEPELTALAATRIEEQQLTMMRESVAAMDRSMQDPDAYIEADLDFHLALAEAAGNPLVLSLLDSIVVLLREQRLGIFTVEGGPERGQAHHRVILDAIERGDVARAGQAMRDHLQQVRKDSLTSASKTGNARARRS